MNENSETRDIGELMLDDKLIERALAIGVRDALRQHKAAGNPVPVWRNNQVVWVPADEIDPELPMRSLEEEDTE